MSRAQVQRDLQALCESWKPALRLQDWKITVVVEPAARMKTTGRCKWYLKQRAAVVRVIDPHEAHLIIEGDLALVCQSIFDPEVTLVHEMLHCVYAPFDAKPNSLEADCQEQSIEAISEALVNLKRASQNHDREFESNGRAERGHRGMSRVSTLLDEPRDGNRVRG